MSKNGKNKFYNKKVRYDGLLFDSLFEREIYSIIKTFDPRVIHHPKIPLIPNTRQKGYVAPIIGFVPSSAWKVPTWTPDFFSPLANCYIEAKGLMTDDFKLKMQVLFQVNSQVLDSLVVVSRKKQEWQGIRTTTCHQLISWLKAHSEGVFNNE